MTNLAALMLLKAVSIEEMRNDSLTWNQLCRELKLDSCGSAFSNIHKRNSNWPEIANGEPYNWRIEYEAVFRKHFEARGTASSLKRIRGVLRTKQAKHAATPELERILSFIEKECGSQANSFGSRGVDTLLEYILRNAESGGKALRLAKRDNDSKLDKGLALDDAIGIVETFWNPTEVRYGERISKAREHIDIVHFHGLSWTNTNREFLQKQLSNPDIEVRVALLDPESPFFAPYADFIDINPDVLKSKYIEVVGIWKKMFKEANAVGNSAKLNLVKYQGFPAKSMYRFDNDLIVTPTTNAKPKSQFIAYRCIKNTDLGNTAYEAYLKEIEWALSNGTEVIGAH